MYSPETDELKRKLGRIATLVVVIILIAFPVYMLVIKDSESPTTAPRVDRDRLQTETDTAEPGERDTFEPPIVTEREPTRRPDESPDIAAEERTEREPATPERVEPPRRPAPAPSIAGDENINFPETPESRTITQSYIIRNTGNRALEIRGMSISGDASEEFSVLSDGSISIEPNDARSIEIEFAPLTMGRKNATLTVESNDPRNREFSIALRGEGIGEEAVESIVRNLYEEGREYFESQRFGTAEELYSNVISIDPFYGPAYLMRGRSRYEQGEYLAAISDFDNVLKYRLSIPSDDRQRVECISLYYAALSVTEQALRTENETERDRLLRPAMGRWEDFKGVCQMDATLIENAGFWMSRLGELR